MKRLTLAERERAASCEIGALQSCSVLAGGIGIGDERSTHERPRSAHLEAND